MSQAGYQKSLENNSCQLIFTSASWKRYQYSFLKGNQMPWGLKRESTERNTGKVPLSWVKQVGKKVHWSCQERNQWCLN